MSTANLNLNAHGDLVDALTTMNNTAPRDWWRYVPCGYCGAHRGQDCQNGDGPASERHTRRRYRAGLLLHGTLWLLTNGHADDVTGAKP